MDLAFFAGPGWAALEGERTDPPSAPQAHVRPIPADGQIALREFLVRKALERAGEFVNQEFSLDFEVRIFHDGGVPGRGLEPLRIAPPDPKSGASANFATLAAEILPGGCSGGYRSPAHSIAGGAPRNRRVDNWPLFAGPNYLADS